MLEQQMQMIKAENVRLRTINQNLKEKQKMAYLNQTSIFEFLEERSGMVDRLEQSIAEGASQAELLTMIDCLRTRSGVYGKQRKELINYLFKGIIDLSFPHFLKNIFYGCTHNLGLFAGPKGELGEGEVEMEVDGGDDSVDADSNIFSQQIEEMSQDINNNDPQKRRARKPTKYHVDKLTEAEIK